MFFIGVDIGKRNHESSIIDASGNLLGPSLSFTNSLAGCEKLLKLLNKLGVTVSNATIGLEATGHYWLSFFSYFSELGYDVKVINPIQSDSFRNMFIRQTKTDSKDSFIIAELMRFGRYTETPYSDEDMMALKQLSRFRLFLVDESSSLKQKAIALLDQVFPEYETLFSDVFGVSSKELLLQCQTPDDILSINNKKLIKLLEKASRGRFGAEKAAQIKLSAQNSFGIKIAKDAFSFQLKQIIEQINFIENQVSELENEISKMLSAKETTITTITGIGDVLGAIILSEIGDINRFSEPSKLVAFAGLDASVKQSGQFNGTQNRLSKRGSPYLRRAIWNASMVAAFKDPMFSKYYEDLRKRGKSHGTSLGAVSRKMCNIIFAILKTNTVYNPNFETSK